MEAVTVRRKGEMVKGRASSICPLASLVCLVAAMVSTACGAESGTAAGGRAVLALDDARAYMVELVNRDRAAIGLKPVALDPVATAAAQKHAEEMAAYAYMAHWNLEGKLPDQRYTEAGGTGAVSENAYLSYRHDRDEGHIPLEAAPAAIFSRQELEEIEAAYFNEQPPYDTHRRNIADPRHTHVGIGLARAQTPGSSRSLANAQEFVNRYTEMDPLPADAHVGDKITVSGRLAAGATFFAIELCRLESPHAMTRDELRKTGHYPVPKGFQVYRDDTQDSPVPVRVTGDGHFSVIVTLSDENRPGVYYVVVKVLTADGRSFAASRRTIVVK